MLFKNKDEINRKRCDRKTHKDMIITVDINEINKKFTVTVQPKNARKLEFVDNLWLPFLDQQQPDILVFSIINVHIYKILVSKWKHGIGPIDIIPFDEE